MEEELPDHVGIDANGAVIAGLQPRRWLRADEIGLRLSGVRHHRRHVQQLGDSIIGAGLGDDHPSVGVTAQDDRPLGFNDRVAARVDVGVQVAELVASLPAAGKRQRDGRDSVISERLGHFSPPPCGIADACAVNKDQSRHTEHDNATLGLRLPREVQRLISTRRTQLLMSPALVATAMAPPSQ